MTDLKGFVHRETDWSWPVFDDSGQLVSPGHAHAREGWTRCGKPWPHVLDHRAPHLGTGYRPPKHLVDAYLRPEDKREAYLCAACLHSIGRPAPQAGPRGELP